MQSPLVDTTSSESSSTTMNVRQNPEIHTFDEDGDLIFSFSDGRQIQVSTKIVSVVTTFFNHMQTISARKPAVSSFEASEFDAILVFCQVCYHRGSEIPLHLDSQILGEIAVVAMDFDCVNAFVPWIDIWTNSLYKTYPTTQTLLDLMAIAYILDDYDGFRRRSRDLIVHMGEEFPYRAFPAPKRDFGGLTDLQNQLPDSIFAAVHDWRQALRWNVQTRLETAISTMLDCSCSAVGFFYLRELRRNGLWPLTGRGSILHIRNLLINGSILTFVAPEGVENCQLCQAKTFAAACKDIGNSIHLGSLGLDLHKWKEIDQDIGRDAGRDAFEAKTGNRGAKRQRQSY